MPGIVDRVIGWKDNDREATWLKGGDVASTTANTKQGFLQARQIVGTLVLVVAAIILVPPVLVAGSSAAAWLMDRPGLLVLAMAMPALCLMVEVFQRSRRN